MFPTFILQEFGDSDTQEKVYLVCSLAKQAKEVISTIKQ
jgi:hypothetical protein